MAQEQCPVNKIESNFVGTAYAEEACPGLLPSLDASPAGSEDGAVWRAVEPNSFPDFGGNITTVARNPISQSRQNKKGMVTDLEAMGGINQDFTLQNSERLLQGFFFARSRQKPTTARFDLSANVPIDEVVADGFVITSNATLGDLGFKVGHLVFAENVGMSGPQVVTAVDATTPSLLEVTIGGALTPNASPAANAVLHSVGFQFGAGAVAMQAPAGAYPRLAATGVDFTTLGLIPGEWIFIGGDGANFQFANNQGWARISSITATTMIFDKVDFAAVAEAGTGKTIRIFWGDLLKNESNPDLIKKLTVQWRRTLGSDEDGVQSEYLIGAQANELTFNMPLAEKITVDMGYVAMDAQQRTGAEGLKPGALVPVEVGDAFNTSSDIKRLKLSKVDPVNGNVAPLFAFATEMTVTINNGVSMDKALGTLGAIGSSMGNFEVGGSMTVYFSTVEAVKAVRQNADVTLDFIVVKANRGFLFDIPLMTLGGGRVTVEANQPVRVPLENQGSESPFGHTLQFQSFRYLPNLAN